MPTVSWVAGIAIRFYYDDHEPPHFHVRGAGFVGRVSITEGAVMELDGVISTRETRLLREWVMARQSALMDNWQRARHHRPLLKIEGLP